MSLMKVGVLLLTMGGVGSSRNSRWDLAATGGREDASGCVMDEDLISRWRGGNDG